MLARALIATLLALSGAAGAQSFSVPPVPRARVYDGANLLSASQKQQLESRLLQLDGQGVQIGVAIFPSLEGEVLETASFNVAQGWGIGEKGKDNGALLAVFMKERKLRIETGYGAEGGLTDLKAGRIIQEQIAPRFRGGDPAAGVVAGVEAMTLAMSGKPLPPPAGGATRINRKAQGFPLGGLLCMAFVVFSMLRGLFGSRRARGFGRRGYGRGYGGGLPWWAWMLIGSSTSRHHGGGGGWGGGGGGGFGGGGGGGFGGGSFGGGGASGDW